MPRPFLISAPWASSLSSALSLRRVDFSKEGPRRSQALAPPSAANRPTSRGTPPGGGSFLPQQAPGPPPLPR